jgi:hypothetical protein
MQTIAIVLDISLENLLNQSHFQNRRRNQVIFHAKKIILLL